MAGTSDLSTLNDLLGLFNPPGSSTTNATDNKNLTQNTNNTTTTTGNTNSKTSGTNQQILDTHNKTTVQDYVSPEAVTSIVNSILSGTSGLAATATGEKKAGLYDSTTNQMLINDLVSRTAAHAAELNKSTTTTTDNTGTVTNVNNSSTDTLSNTIANLVGTIGQNTKDTSTKDINNKGQLNTATTGAVVGGLLGADGLSKALTGSGLVDNAGKLVKNIFGGSTDNFGIPTSSAGNGINAATQAASDADINYASGIYANNGGDGSSGYDYSGMDNLVNTITGEGEGTYGPDAFGGTLGSTIGKLIPIPGASTVGKVIGTYLPDAVNGVGNIVDGAFNAIDKVFDAWIICTELMKQGRLPKRYWLTGSMVFNCYPESVKRGYYYWAMPSVKHLRAKPTSLYSKLLITVFKWRAENIAAHAGIKGARKLWRGAAVTAILYPVCFILGHTVARKPQNWKGVYGHAE